MPSRNLVLHVDQIPRFRLTKGDVWVAWPIEVGQIDLSAPWDIFCPAVAAASEFIHKVREAGGPTVVEFPSGRARDS